MKLYSWLQNPYNQIIYQYFYNKNNTILINSIPNLGMKSLVNKISAWLFCEKKILTQNCNYCHSCELIKNKSHPNFLIIKKENKKIGIDIIQNIINNIHYSAYQKNIKVIWISDINELTEHASNALLKILEEPPKNVRIILSTFVLCNVLPTLKSRCIIIKINKPNEKEAILWLKNNISVSKKNIYLTALRISYGIPKIAFNLIKIWDERCFFYKNFFILLKNDILDLIKIFNSKIIYKVNWICSILIDAIKLQNNIKNFVRNLDQITSIKKLSSSLSSYILLNSIFSWKRFQLYILKNKQKNTEFILIEQLLNWEKILKLKN